MLRCFLCSLFVIVLFLPNGARGNDVSHSSFFRWLALFADYYAVHLVTGLKDNKNSELLVRADVDDDGKNDVIAIFGDNEKNGIALYQFDEAYRLKKSADFPDIPSFDRNNADSCLLRNSDDGRPEICTIWKKPWYNVDCSELLLRDNKLNVTVHQTTICRNNPDTCEVHRFDFVRMTAERFYRHIANSVSAPVRFAQNRYAMILTPFGEKIENANYLLLPHFSVFPSKDLNPETEEKNLFSLRSTWNENALKLHLKIHAVPNASPMHYPMLKDHAELWLDLSQDFQNRKIDAEDYTFAYERDYRDFPFRHQLDATIFALYFDPGESKCAQPIHPSLIELWPAWPEVACTVDKDGYEIRVTFPASFFGVQNLKDFEGRTDGIGFTAIAQISGNDDSDPAVPFKRYATSHWKWGDPFSFGQLWMFDKHTPQLPTFPFDWDKWLKLP